MADTNNGCGSPTWIYPRTDSQLQKGFSSGELKPFVYALSGTEILGFRNEIVEPNQKHK